MYNNKAKQKMLRGEPAIGAEVGLGSILSVERISPLGFDFVLVDNQHGYWSSESSMSAFRMIHAGGTVPMARVGKNDFAAIGRLLDMGCMGIVIPMVNTVEEAKQAVFAARYPPEGGRSIGPFGTEFLGENYDDWADREIFLAVQIETGEGALNAKDIMAVDGIDGCWIGPGDLSRYMRLDLTTENGRKVHKETILKVISASMEAGKISGISTPSADQAGYWIDEGCLFVTAGSDSEWVVDKGNEVLRALQRKE